VVAVVAGIEAVDGVVGQETGRYIQPAVVHAKLEKEVVDTSALAMERNLELAQEARFAASVRVYKGHVDSAAVSGDAEFQY
jgi:hypothetical protein